MKLRNKSSINLRNSIVIFIVLVVVKRWVT